MHCKCHFSCLLRIWCTCFSCTLSFLAAVLLQCFQWLPTFPRIFFESSLKFWSCSLLSSFREEITFLSWHSKVCYLTLLSMHTDVLPATGEINTETHSYCIHLPHCNVIVWQMSLPRVKCVLCSFQGQSQALPREPSLSTNQITEVWAHTNRNTHSHKEKSIYTWPLKFKTWYFSSTNEDLISLFYFNDNGCYICICK